MRNDLIILQMDIIRKFPEIFDDNKHSKAYKGGRIRKDLTPESAAKLRKLRKIVYGVYYGIAPQRKIQIFEWHVFWKRFRIKIYAKLLSC
jgi:hypothetical protein